MAAYDSVRVACRFRPPNEREKSEGASDIIIDILDCNKQVKIRGKKNHIFTFDRAFNPNASQKEVFEHTGAPLVDHVLQGINCTLFAYGQTGSGKTHTMEGHIGSIEMEGLIPRMIRKVFDSIQNMKDDVRYALRVSYVEIYNEKLRDLLDPSLTPRVRGGLDGSNIIIEQSHEQYVTTPDQVFEILYAGQSNRSVSATKMNSASSRSHAVFTLFIDREELSNGTKKKSKLLMVDLAGSEKVKKTEAKGALLEEAKNINQSLSTLGNVINSLTKGLHHIPYRDSVLTRLLSDALGGNSKTMLIIAASPCKFNEEETLSTLRFGKRAKEIKNRVAVNEELSIDQYKARLAAAKLKIANLIQHNNTLKKKVREMMVVSSKSSDKSIIDRFEKMVQNIDLNLTTKQSVKSSPKQQKKQNKLSKHLRHRTSPDSPIKHPKKSKKNSKISRSMSVQINSADLERLSLNEEENENLLPLHHTDANAHSINISDDHSLEKDAEILSLKKKLNEMNEELNRAENAERLQNDQNLELYEGHLQLREEFVEQSEKLKQCELHNDASQTKIEALQTLLDDQKLRSTQKQQLWQSKEKCLISKLERLQKEILILKQQTKRFIPLPQRRRNNNNASDGNIDCEDSKDGNCDILEVDFNEISSNQSQNVQLKAFLNKTKEDHSKHKLLQERYKKMNEILKCYKQRDETNFLLRKSWSKHMACLEKALCQQDAATIRWREQSKAHEEILKTEIERLRNNIRHFEHFKRFGCVNANLVRRGSGASDDTASVTSAPSFALHHAHHLSSQQQQQPHILQGQTQPFVSSYHRISHQPTYIVPTTYKYVQPIAQQNAFPMGGIPQIQGYVSSAQDFNL